jgi:hypothetical protein
LLTRDAANRVFSNPQKIEACLPSAQNLRALDQRISRRNQSNAVQFSSESIFIGGDRCSGKALPELRDFCGASAAAADFRTTAGCGHKFSLTTSFLIFRMDLQTIGIKTIGANH